MIPSSAPPRLAFRLILASSSAYRRELLERLRLPFEAIAPSIDETPHAGEAPQETALRLAREKAAAVARLHPGALVIGSDQVATLDGLQIGKPGTHARALEQLQLMRGRRVVFHTALCLWDGRVADPAQAARVAQVENVQVFVDFRDLPDAELDAYLRIEQPYDCAGSAKNEGLGIALLERIESSDPTALTGLPLIALTGMLRRAGVPFFAS
ncbi:MAG: Maf family nucleotide pyrophosphatase [Janthinobacterium lividum]